MAADYDFGENRMRKEMKSSNHYILVLYLKVPLIANDCFVKYPKRRSVSVAEMHYRKDEQ